jgi:hypothetical protein
MSTSIVFTGSGFSLQSATPRVPGTVRVRFTADPLQASSLAPNDGLNPNNWTFTGPTLAVVSSVVIVSGDPQALDVILTAPLAFGSWTVAAANIQTPALNNLTSPTSISFTVSQTGNSTSFTAGAENDDPESIIRKHLNPSLKGPNWNAIIAGLSRGDQINRDNARLAFDQLYITSASQKYLDRLLANDGIRRPEPVGLNDERFRKLGINLRTHQVIHESIREILEVYYGRDALHAWVETELAEPFALADGQTLELDLDESRSVRIEFLTENFQVIGLATAAEVATVLTKAIQDAGDQGFADYVQDPETGDVRVRIYSGTLGLKSFVRVTGGSAQPFLRFSTYKEVYSGNVTPGAHTWTYTLPEPGVTELTLTTTGITDVNLTSVIEGDYVVVGGDAGSVPGVYPVKEVTFEWAGASFLQHLYLDQDIGFTGAAVQQSNDAYRFFTPTREDTTSGYQSVVVTQTLEGILNVVLPATSEAVTRGPRQAAYGRLQDSVEISRVQRSPSGLVTVDTVAAHGLETGNQATIDGFVAAASTPWVSKPAAGNLGGSWVSTWAATANTPVKAGSAATTVKFSSGTVFAVGGLIYAAGIPSETSNCVRFVPGAVSTVTDGTEAEGSPLRAYTTPATASMAQARQRHGMSLVGIGNYAAAALVTGGIAAGVVLSSCEVYSEVANTWTTVAPLSVPRQGHQQVDLVDGRVMVCGGTTLDGTALNSVEIWNPALNTWTTMAPMNYPRIDHGISVLSDGKVLVMGGRTLGQLTPTTTAGLFAYWGFDEAGGTTPADYTAGARTLTTAAGPTITKGKVLRSLNFGSGVSSASRAGDAPSQAVFAGEWSVDFYLQTGLGTAVTDQTIFAYGMAGADAVQANNTLIEIISTAGGNFKWRWEHGAGVDVTGTSTATFATEGHYALVKKFNGSNYDVSLYFNGTLKQTWTSQTAADGGTDGAVSYYFCLNPETGVDGYQGIIDDFKVWNKALTAVEIRKQFLRVQGYSLGWEVSSAYAGDVNDSAEIYNPIGNTWTVTSPMQRGRAEFKTLPLANDRVLVIGGLGYDRTQLPSFTATAPQNWPLQSLAEAEVWDRSTGRWYPAGKMAVPRHRQAAAIISGKNLALIGNGTSQTFNIPSAPTAYATAPDLRAWEYVNTDTLNWSLTPLRADHPSSWSIEPTWAQAGDGGIVVLGGNIDYSTGATFSNLNVYLPGLGELSASGGINDSHRVTKISSTRFTFETPSFPSYTSNFGSSRGGGADFKASTHTFVDYSNTWVVLSFGVRASNVTTLTVSSVDGISVGDRVYVNSEAGAFTSGIYTVTAVDASTPTISYTEVAANFPYAAITGGLSLDHGAGTVTAAKSLPQPLNDPGPFVFDADAGLPILATKNPGTGNDVVTTSALTKDQQYSVLSVDNTAVFPDGVGYIVLGFGGPIQSKPIKYLEKISATELLLDYDYIASQDWPAGTPITLLVSRQPQQPPSSTGAFYATDSNAGRVAAQDTVRKAAASGFEINFDVVYPGDRGLGGEGFPTEGSGKLSDKVRVWGPGNLDDVDGES